LIFVYNKLEKQRTSMNL